MGTESGESAAREIVTIRELSAHPAAVFAAFSQAAALQSWWGPAGFTNLFEEFEFRPGGAWRVTMVAADGSEYPNESHFVEIVAPERIVLQHHGPPHEYRATFQFMKKNGGTVLTGGCCMRRAPSAPDCAR